MQNTDSSHKDSLLIEFRNKYGKVARFTINDITFYVRCLYFDEWIELSRTVKLIVEPDGKIQHDISDKEIAQYILPCILRPQHIPPDVLSKPNHISLIVTTVLSISEFDKPDILLKKYKKALARQQLLGMEMRRTLVATYGIAILDYFKKASVDDIIDLIAMREWITQELGSFGVALGEKQLFPKSPTGKMNVQKMMETLQSWLYEIEPAEKGKEPDINAKTPQRPPEFSTPPPVVPPKVSVRPPTGQKVRTDERKITISDVEKMGKTVESREITPGDVHPPKLYDGNSDMVDSLVTQRNKKEFGGRLVDLWNENMVTLYEKIQRDILNPKKVKNLGDIQKEDDKSNVVIGEDDG